MKLSNKLRIVFSTDHKKRKFVAENERKRTPEEHAETNTSKTDNNKLEKGSSKLVTYGQCLELKLGPNKPSNSTRMRQREKGRRKRRKMKLQEELSHLYSVLSCETDKVKGG